MKENLNYVKGRSAFAFGWKKDDCGYPEGPGRDDWRRGWEDAKKDKEGKV